MYFSNGIHSLMIHDHNNNTIIAEKFQSKNALSYNWYNDADNNFQRCALIELPNGFKYKN